MELEEAKLFVGGITWDTTEETLRDHFSKYGDVTHAVVMHDKITGRPRGFGFVIFSDASALHSALLDQHTIDGRLVEAKRALSREEQNNVRQEPSNGGRASGGGGNNRTKKVFVGGLPPSVTEEEFRQYFDSFGLVTDAVIMFDQSTQRPRGFGFVSFDTDDAVERVLQKNFHDLNGKDVEVKRALPKDSNQASGNRGGGYQNYGSSRGNSGSYDNRMEGNRYMQPQSGGFSSYPGYGAAGYGGGYGGPAGSYGGYGGYGAGGYAGGAGGFAGHAGGYGGSNAGGAAGYGSGPANAMKAAWSNQTAGYGAAGYGAGYGPAVGYGSVSSAQAGQLAGGGSGYGNQAYGGGYGGNGYGAVGGRTGSGQTGNPDGGEQSAPGSGYMGSGYGENNRNSGYSGGYGDAQSWQGQQQ
ncbi:hypothetical protein RND81_05G214100 [Saponaria officinalis]|uniref:RRM domain-containing protein n=1 Tax=Saponaria officinalis TaxID=3572 RepID=A0AAW1KZ86_SAPOF